MNKESIIRPLKLKNTVQHYAWGSHSAIQQLTDTPPSDEPWAELWMGAHPKAPSQVRVDGKWIPLDQYISRFPEILLGKNIAEKFNNTLPYLFKVLAAEQPLSIQAHPSADQAIKGFEKESEFGPDMSDPRRNYKDNSHKPECICALTPFTGLKGFRKLSSSVELLEHFCPAGLAEAITILRQKDLKHFFRYLMELPASRKAVVIREAVRTAETKASSDQISEWILKLHRQYPADIGVISPLFLNLFSLEPGQALFLPAGELHAYLDGLGIELMANSDNVLRGGLTPKHVDVPELLNVLNFVESEIDILMPENISGRERHYPVLAEEFKLTTIQIEDSIPYISEGNHSVEIILCVHGHSTLTSSESEAPPIYLNKGESVFIPAALKSYQITGNARFYKAGVPI